MVFEGDFRQFIDAALNVDHDSVMVFLLEGERMLENLLCDCRTKR